LIFTSIIKLQIHNYIEIFEKKIKRIIRTKKLKRYDLKIQVMNLFFYEKVQLNKYFWNISKKVLLNRVFKDNKEISLIQSYLAIIRKSTLGF